MEYVGGVVILLLFLGFPGALFLDLIWRRHDFSTRATSSVLSIETTGGWNSYTTIKTETEVFQCIGSIGQIQLNAPGEIVVMKALFSKTTYFRQHGHYAELAD